MKENEEQQKNMKKWYILNILLFFIPFKAFDWGLKPFIILSQMSKDDIGLSMIVLFPIFAVLFGLWMIGIGIASVVYNAKIIKNILNNSQQQIFKTICIIEIIIYIIYLIYRLMLII